MDHYQNSMGWNLSRFGCQRPSLPTSRRLKEKEESIRKYASQITVLRWSDTEDAPFCGVLLFKPKPTAETGFGSTIAGGMGALSKAPTRNELTL